MTIPLARPTWWQRCQEALYPGPVSSRAEAQRVASTRVARSKVLATSRT